MESLLNKIFPCTCGLCGNLIDRGNLCPICYSEIKFIDESVVCKKCGIPLKSRSVDRSEFKLQDLCGECVLNQAQYKCARSLASYDGALRHALHRYKYQGELRIGPLFSDLLFEHFPKVFDEFDIVIPVPMHLKRLREREFNHMVIIGESLTKKIGAVFDPYSLRKIKETKPQIEFKDRTGRRRNVKGAFGVPDNVKIVGKSVLLLDDVFTTGATSDECVKTLLSNGVESVQVLTLMRTVSL